MESLENLYSQWSKLSPKVKIDGDILLFGRYRLENLLGIGGTSLVLSAFDLILKRLVAIKIWNPYTGTFSYWETSDNKFFKNETEYFRREAQILASLKHPNLCQIYDFGINTDGIPWLTLELFEGATLREFIQGLVYETNKHNLKDVLTIARQITSAIDFLHRNGLFQLDIKPENILVRENTVKVIDIASSLEKPNDGFDISQARYGTPGYVAPEIVNSLNNENVCPASDVFSLGVTFLEMICLHNPLATERIRSSAYEALGVIERDIFGDYSTARFFPDFNSDIKKWGESYKSELTKLDISQILKSAPIGIPDTFIDLVSEMMSLRIFDRPRNAGEVLKRLVFIESTFNHNSLNTNFNNMSKNEKTSILFLTSDPTNASRLRLGEELREIQEKLKLAELRDNFKLSQRMSVRPVDVSQAILDEKPQIIHFSGHGASSGELCFENTVGESQLIQPDDLAALFELVSDQVICVLLNACYSEIQAKAIAKHIKYVIGMNKAIGDKAAISFAIGFYQALGAGKSISEAYKFGCVQIRLQGIPEHLTPVLITK